MKKTYRKIKNIFNNKYGIIYAYSIIFILCFFIIAGQNIRTNPYDDILHSQAVQKFDSAWNFMLNQYEYTNSRYFTSFIMAYVMDKNIWLWRILNSIVLFIFIIYIYYLFSKDNESYI